MTTLYLCEKPSQARDIGKVLGAMRKQEHHLEGNGVIVTWCFGHLLETVPPEAYGAHFKQWKLLDLPIIPDDWKLLPVVKAKKQFQAIQKLLKHTQHVIIATDADREGEVIGREVLTYCNYRGRIDRLWLSALDDDSIRKALTRIKPGHETEALYAAGLGRQRADWLVGMNMTRAATCAFATEKGNVLSVGRVQTPTLKLIVDRGRHIEQFKPKDYYLLLAQFSDDQNHRFWAKWQASPSILDEHGYCCDKHQLGTFLAKIANATGTVQEFKEQTLKLAPPLCLSLSALQKLASAKFGFSAKKTLDVAQSLYETHKALTYPRTDCGYLPESQLRDAPSILEALTAVDNTLDLSTLTIDTGFKSPTWNDQKVTAHHAIIPTRNRQFTVTRLSPDELSLYQLVRQYYLAQFCGDYVYQNRKVTVLCQGEFFKASSNTPVTLGWKQLVTHAEDEEEQPEKDDHLSVLPHLAPQQKVQNTAQRIDAKKTKPPAYFTEGTLIDAMKHVAKTLTDPALKKVLKETAGIGTEATRATVIETLFKRGYILRKAKQLHATEQGQQLVDILPKQLTEPALTAYWEQALDEVANGQLKLDSFLVQQAENVKTLVDTIAQMPSVRTTTNKPAPTPTASSNSNARPCPVCQQPMQQRKGKNGAFYGCSAYPTCKTTLPMTSQAALKKPHAVTKPLAKTAPLTACPTCHTGQLRQRQGKHGSFWGCSAYPTCKAAFKTLPTGKP